MSLRSKPGSISITQNPVTRWEQFNYMATPEKFIDFDNGKRAEGGYWSCRFKLFDRRNVLREMFENGLGRDVKIWGYGLEPIFEGFIYDMSYNLPPDIYNISMASIVNKIWMRADYDADDVVERSTALTDAGSISKFGTIEKILSGGQLENLATADQSTQTFLNTRAYPKAAVDKGNGRGKPYLDILAKGYIHTLGWMTYNYTAPAGTQNMTNQITDVVASAEFVASVSAQTNSTTIDKIVDADRKMLDIVNGLVRLGDPQYNRWIAYMTFGRKLVLKQAAPVEVGS